MGRHRFRLQPLLVGTPSLGSVREAEPGLYLQHPKVLPKPQPPNSKDAKSPKEGVEPYYKPGAH